MRGGPECSPYPINWIGKYPKSQWVKPIDSEDTILLMGLVVIFCVFSIATKLLRDSIPTKLLRDSIPKGEVENKVQK